MKKYQEAGGISAITFQTSPNQLIYYHTWDKSKVDSISTYFQESMAEYKKIEGFVAHEDLTFQTVNGMLELVVQANFLE